MRCSICEKPQVEAISEALASGESIRATARRFGVPRSTLARHRDHAAVVGMSAKDLPPRIAKLLRSTDASERAEGQFRAAEAALKRAEDRGRVPQILEALKGFRSAVLLVARQARIKDELPERDVKRLEYAYKRTLDAYRRTVGRGDIELRALSGLRSALDALGAASRRPPRTGWVTTAFADGSGRTEPVPIDLARTPEWAEGGVLQLRWLGLAGLEVVEGEGG